MKFSLEAEASDLKSSGVHLEEEVTFPFDPPHFHIFEPSYHIFVGLNLIFIYLHFCKRKSLGEVIGIC